MKRNNSKLEEYFSYRELNRNFFTLLGWSNIYSNIIYRLIPYIHLFFGVTISIVAFGSVRLNYRNISLLIRSFGVMMSFILVSLKIASMIIYKKEIFELHECLDRHFMNMLKKEYLPDLIIHKVTKYRLLSLSGSVVVLFCNVFFNVIPLKNIISNHIHNIQPNYHMFPYPSVFPWHVPFTGFIYHLHFIYESFTSITVVIVSPGVDSIFAYFIFMMIGELREIAYNITHIENESDNNFIIKRCIHQYCKLRKYCDTIQRIYGPIIICLITTNAIVLCTSMYQITQLFYQNSLSFMRYLTEMFLRKASNFSMKMHSISILKLSLFFTYMAIKIIQTYIYSWCGTHLTMESEECRNAIYSANWYGDKRFMNAITIMLQQRPLVLTACSLATVSVDIFAKIMNTTISYYFLLKTVE